MLQIQEGRQYESQNAQQIPIYLKTLYIAHYFNA